MPDQLSGVIVISETNIILFDDLQHNVPKQTFATSYIFGEDGTNYTWEYQQSELKFVAFDMARYFYCSSAFPLLASSPQKYFHSRAAA